MKKFLQVATAVAVLVLLPRPVWGMHIMEGFLPAKWALFWTIVSLPFVGYGVVSISQKLRKNPELKLLMGLVGAFAFVLSALKIPSISGSSSHPTGVGLGAVLFGPFTMSVLGCIVLLFQAMLLAHGGLTTLGANTFSMAVVGPFVAFGTYRLCGKVGLSKGVALFMAAFLGDLLTYVTTSFQLALAFPAAQGGVTLAAYKFLGVFAFTQFPLAVTEGLLTLAVFNFLAKYSRRELYLLNIFQKKEGDLRDEIIT